MNTWSFSKKGMKTLLAAERYRQGLKEKSQFRGFPISLSYFINHLLRGHLRERESLCALCPPIHYSNPVLTWAATKVSVHNSSFKKKSTCTVSSWHQSPAQKWLQGTFNELERCKWQIILASDKHYGDLRGEPCVTNSAQRRALCAGCEHQPFLPEQEQRAATADRSWYICSIY